MRAKRSKQYRKLMQQYQLNFHFREPYQVLLDAAIIQAAARFKMKLGALLESTLHAKAIKPMITQCCIRHLYNAPAETEAQKREKDAWIDVAKHAERRRCGHHELEEPLSTEACLLSVVDPKGSGTNKHRYVVATQDPAVRARMRQIAGVPLIYINRSVMILEPMAARTEEVREAEEKGKIRAGLKGRRPTAAGGVKRKRDDDDDDENNADADIPERAKAIAAAEKGALAAPSDRVPKKRKVKGPKGPNPLSVKKPKKDKPPSATHQGEDGSSAARQTTKDARQAADGAVHATVAADEHAEGGTTDGPRKRKRKRKPRDGHVEIETPGAEARNPLESVAD